VRAIDRLQQLQLPGVGLALPAFGVWFAGLPLGLTFRSRDFRWLAWWRGTGPGSRASRVVAIKASHRGTVACRSIGRPSVGGFASDHRRCVIPLYQLANSAADDPGGFPCHAQRLLKSANSNHFRKVGLFEPSRGEGDEVNRLKPETQVEVAGLEDGADFDGERPAAPIALVGPASGACALQLPDPFPCGLAMWALRTGRPKQGRVLSSGVGGR